MANFDNIIQEINTNLPDNTSQAITAAKLRNTMIDLTNAIEVEQTDFESAIVVDSLKSSETTKALSANNGYELSKRSTMLEFVGADNTLQTDYLYCLSGHKYKIYLDNTQFTWNNVTYSTSGYYIWRITVIDYNNANETVISSRGCDNKVDPLNPTYTFTADKNGYIRFSFRADEGQTLRIRIEDITTSSSLEDSIDDINGAFSTEVTPSVVSTITGQFYAGTVGSAISTSSSSAMRGTQFAVTPGKEYHLVDRLTSSYTNLYLVRYTDANNIILSRYYWTTSTNYSFDATSKAPDNAAYAYVNYLSTYASTFSFKELQTNFVNVNNINETTTENATAIGTINGQIETMNGEIQDIQDSFKYEEGRVDAEYDSTISGSFWYGGKDAEISTQSSASTARGRRYIVTGGNTYHLTVTIPLQYYGFYMIRWCDENNIIVKREENITNTGSSHPFDKDYVAPDNAAYFYINYASTNTPTFQEIVYGTANVGQMASDIEDLKEITSDYSKKLMKVVIRSMTGYGWINAYYIRTKYNDTQDIIIQNQINSNTLLSFYAAYVGPNTLEDSQLRTSAYLVCDCDDSTAPFYGSTLYWHLYAQHGVPIPVINNNVNMTQLSVGTLWQDTITSGGEPFVRQYHIGYVSSSKIYLLPVFYEDSEGRMTRGWKNEANSTAITLLEYVDAGTGTNEGITQINVTGYTQEQKRPIIKNSNRHFYADNIEITQPGTYYCDELKVSESQVGYDPATITDANYFSGSSNRVNLEGALPLVEFTWSYLYKGATCAMNTTVKMLREFRCQSYGAIQQQYFHNLNYDNKTYTAKFLIPKCKLNSMNVPFTEPSSARQYYRISSNLVDVNDPVDRQIGWLENTSGTNDFRVGLAAGLSLVTGDTVKEKRIQNIPVGDRPAGATTTSSFWRLGSISPSNTNKFYIAAINTAPYQDNNYNFPVGMFKEINCYVSYFDPAQNFGQVYWYKDGNSYLIYCHAQSASQNQVINVPEYMEGLNLSIVEKTDNAELLTSTITNGKFYVTYTGDDQVKYIVLKAS